jgi:hypothetical protein
VLRRCGQHARHNAVAAPVGNRPSGQTFGPFPHARSAVGRAVVVSESPSHPLVPRREPALRGANLMLCPLDLFELGD